MRTLEEKRRDMARMEYLCELVAVQGESLAKNLHELADTSERLGFTAKSVESLRAFANAIGDVKSLANMNKGGATWQSKS